MGSSRITINLATAISSIIQEIASRDFENVCWKIISLLGTVQFDDVITQDVPESSS